MQKTSSLDQMSLRLILMLKRVKMMAKMKVAVAVARLQQTRSN
jgi:hypothetical protein